MKLYKVFIPTSDHSAEYFQLEARSVEEVLEDYPSADKVVELDSYGKKDVGGIYRTREGKWKPLFGSDWN